QYAYSEMDSSGSYANHSRPKSLTYPDGRVVNYVYGGGLDNAMSRLSSITNSATTYERYFYLGLGTVVKRAHLDGANEIGLTYLEQAGDPACTPGVPPCDAGDQYRGLDRFGRVADQRWIKFDDVTNPKDRFQYGY